MRACVSAVVFSCFVISACCAGCGSDDAQADVAATFSIHHGACAREVIRRDGEKSPRVAEVLIFWTGQATEIEIVPMKGQRIDCAAVCVSGIPSEPEDCRRWRLAGRNQNGRFSVEVSDSAVDPPICSAIRFIHVRLRIAHHGECDI